MSRRLLLIASLTAWLSLLGTGCSGTYRTRILLPLAGNPDRMAGEQCDRECRLGHNEGDYEYLRCLVTCPGVEVAHEMACSEEDHPPRSICRVTDLDLEARTAVSASGGDSGGAWLGALVGAIAVGAIESATRSKSSSSSEDNETASTSSRSKGSVSLPAAPASTAKSSHSSAQPSSKGDSHKSAEPKRGK